jgi:hypothetical protein
MIRILLPLSIGGVLLAQVPTATWEQMSAMGLMGVVLIWLVTKTLPAKDAQAVALATVFAASVETGQTKTAELAEKFTALAATQTATLSVMNEKMLEVGQNLAKAIGETGAALSSLQAHCGGVAEKAA